MQISTEYRKGVLFVRIIGRIDNNDYLKVIDKLVNDFGIKYVVINIENIKCVSLECIDHIKKYNNEILKKKKYLLICDSNLRRKGIFKNIVPNVSSELDAFSLI